MRAVGSGALLVAAGGGTRVRAQDDGADGAGTDGDDSGETDGDDLEAPWDLFETGVESWDLVVRETDESMAEPSVTDVREDVGDGRVLVVVTGTHEFSRSGCDTIYPRRVAYSDHLDRLGVVVDQVAEHEVDPAIEEGDQDCGDSTQLLEYELSVEIEDVPGRVVVGERFTEPDRSVHYLEDSAEPDIAREVADYDLTLDSGLGHDGSVEEPPEVEFRDDELVVTGAVSGPNTCYTARLDRLEYRNLTRHDFRVDVESVISEDHMPGDGCGGAEVQIEYELVVTFEEELPPHVTVDENGERRARVQHPDGGPRTHGIDAYEFESAYSGDGDLEAEPPVTFDGDAVTVRGSRTYPTTGCRAPVPEFLSFDDDSGRVGVAVDDHQTSEACAQATSTVVYELTVELPGEVSNCVVETRFDDRERTIYYADGPPERELPTGIADYELTLDDGSAGDVEEPSVTFDGADVIVEGTTWKGSSSCGSIALETLEWASSDRDRLELDVVESTRRDHLPYQDCTDDEAMASYELVVTTESDLPAEVAVSEQGQHRVTVERDADEGLPPGVEDVELVVGEDAHDHAVEPPNPTTEFTDEGFVARGDYFVVGSSNCKTIAVDEIEFATEDRRHLGVTLADAYRSDLVGDVDCTTDEASEKYRLEVTFSEERPRTVTVVEDDVDSQFSHVTDRGRDPVSLPDGVSDYELTERFDYAAPMPEPRVEFDDDRVTVEASLTLSGRSCTEIALLDAAYEDDAAEHLGLELGGVYQRGESPFGGCTLDEYTVKYTLELSVDDLPQTVTVDERGGDDAHTVTVEREDCAASETVDGQTVCDLDGDGSYRDVNGDGSVTNSDVTEFFANQHTQAWNERVDLFDFDGNDDVGQSDVVALFEYVN